MSTAVYPPPAEFAAKARVKSLDEYRDLYRRAEAKPGSLLGRLRHQEHPLVRKMVERSRMESAVREMVRRRQNQCLL